jgi:hypothetical protein
MRIKEYINYDGRNFLAMVVCENCGTECKMNGYYENYFFKYTLPEVKCGECDKSRNDMRREQGESTNDEEED